MTYDSTEGFARLYLNGVELSDSDYARKDLGCGAIDSNNNPLELGRHQTSAFSYDGRIDEVRVSNTVRKFIPEPGSLVLLGSGLLAGLLFLVMRCRTRRG